MEEMDTWGRKEAHQGSWKHTLGTAVRGAVESLLPFWVPVCKQRIMLTPALDLPSPSILTLA